MQTINVRVQFLPDTEEPVLFRKYVNGTETINGKDVEIGSTIIQLETTTSTLLGITGKAVDRTRVANYTLPHLDDRKTLKVLRSMLADPSVLDEENGIIKAYNKGLDFEINEGGAIIVQEFEMPVVEFSKGNAPLVIEGIKKAIKLNGANETFNYYFTNLLRRAIRNCKNGATLLSHFVDEATEEFSFDKIDSKEINPTVKTEICKQISDILFGKNAKLKKFSSNSVFCKAGDNYIYSVKFFSNKPEIIEANDDILVPHTNQAENRKAMRLNATKNLAVAKESSDFEAEELSVEDKRAVLVTSGEFTAKKAEKLTDEEVEAEYNALPEEFKASF